MYEALKPRKLVVLSDWNVTNIAFDVDVTAKGLKDPQYRPIIIAVLSVPSYTSTTSLEQPKFFSTRKSKNWSVILEPEATTIFQEQSEFAGYEDG